ncbi:MAG TPA: NUDIX hydrolase [Anaerolineae bacterium]|nr:NUDIX hydrolase [Anaerolineae bacterium]
MSREYPLHPIPGVGVIAFKDNTVLLVQRGKEPRRGEWSIPGGAVEVGETVREAALREFAEECGGDIELRDLVDVVDIFGRDDENKIRYHYIVADYWAEWRGGELYASSDVMDARWVSPDQLDEYGLPSYTRAVIEKAVQMRNHAR